MKRLFLAIVFLSFSVPAMASPSCASIPFGALQLLCEDAIKLAKEWQNTIGHLKGYLAQGRADANAEKQKTSTVAWINGAISLAKRTQSLKRNLGSYRPVFNGGHVFMAGAIAGITCLKKKEETAFRKHATEVLPRIQESIAKMEEGISGEKPTAVRRAELAKEVYQVMKGYTERGNPYRVFNPFNVNKPFPIEELPNYVLMGKYLTNPAMPQKNKELPYTSAQYHRTRVRYEMFVSVVQSAMLHDLSHWATIDRKYSEYHLFKRMEAKHNSPLTIKSLAVKTPAGVMRHNNQVIADTQIIKAANARIQEDINSLLTIIATETTDEIAKK